MEKISIKIQHAKQFNLLTSLLSLPHCVYNHTLENYSKYSDFQGLKKKKRLAVLLKA